MEIIKYRFDISPVAIGEPDLCHEPLPRKSRDVSNLHTFCLQNVNAKGTIHSIKGGALSYPYLYKSEYPYMQEKYRENNVRNISLNMCDPESLQSMSQIMCVNLSGCGMIIRNIIINNGVFEMHKLLNTQ